MFQYLRFGEPTVLLAGPHKFVSKRDVEHAARAGFQRDFAEIVRERREEFLGEPCRAKQPPALGAVFDADTRFMEGRAHAYIVRARFVDAKGGRFSRRLRGILALRIGEAPRMPDPNQPNDSSPREKIQYDAIVMLARGVAHDINNLLTGVMGNSAVLRQSLADHPEYVKRLNEIEGATDKAVHLAARLLAFVEGEKPPPQVINLNPIVAHALHVEEQKFAPRIRVKRFLDPDLLNVAADLNAIGQIILSVCNNALHTIGHEEGRITLTTQNISVDSSMTQALAGLEPGPYVLFSVEDTGGGMADDDVTQIFAPGSGALSEAYMSVKDHRGYIRVRSEHGIGTTTEVYLPATDAAIGTEATLEGDRATGHETVLVIDDEQMILDVTRSVLENAGYHVLTAGGGEEALHLAETYDGTIHIALMDMAMPGMGGAETYPRLMKLRPGIRVIVMSGYDLGALEESLLNSGVNGVLQKPFRSNALLSAVQDAAVGAA